jgi:hypothetical protein
MKLIFSTLLSGLLLGSIISAYSQEKNIYGKEVLSIDGKRINYTESQLTQSEASFDQEKVQLKSAERTQSSDPKPPIYPKIQNMFSIMGTSIGRNSMHSIDLDHDGVLELVCTAASQGFGNGNFWYIMRYDAVAKNWNQVWVSAQETNRISTLEIIDFNNDGNNKILIGFDNGMIKIYDGLSKELLQTVSPVAEKINSIVYADADNDSQKDVVISCISNTYVLNAVTYSQKYKINQGANYVRVGKLDGSILNSIVLSSGFIYKLNHQTLTTTWNYNASGEGYVELSDIDQDSMQEVVFAQSWQHIYVYDVDIKTTKYGIDTDLDIQSLLLTDVNKDGIDEIIYGDGQWGSVHCFNSVSRERIWKVANPEHGVAAINYADLNNDGNKELIWSAGWTSTGADYLYIYNVAESNLIWRSDDIVGPFYAVASGDVDGDGKSEIVAVSYASVSGYEGGILVIMDAETNQLKWKSSGNFFYQNWTGLFNILIDDVDNDGSNEIIIASGQLYTGEIWILDGKNHTIKSFHVFSNENISEFYSLAIDDIDQDNQKEFIATSNSSTYIINPTNWSIEWQVSSSTYSIRPIVKTADINGDGTKEIIVCQQNIKVINSSNHSYWTTPETDYTNIEIFDSNSDGILDIVASTSNGRIVVIDGNSRSLISEISPENSKISSVRVVKTGNTFFYVYSCDGRININQNGSNCGVSDYFGENIGEIEGLKIFNSKAGSIEVLIGTSISVLRMYLSILQVSSNNLIVEAPENSTVKFDLTTTKNWSISSSQSWLKLSSSSGTGNSTVTVSAKANDSVEKRTAILTISGEGSNSQLITVIQNGAPPVLNVSTPSLIVDGGGEGNTFDIISNTKWLVHSSEDWLTFNQTSGSGNFTMGFYVISNPTLQSRTATISVEANGVSTQKITVTQKAGTASLSVWPQNFTVSAVVGNPDSFSINTNIDWIANCDQSWLTLSAYAGKGYSVIEMTESGNPTIVPRTAVVTISGKDVISQTVTVIQEGQLPNLIVSTNTIRIGASANNKKTVYIASNINWTITCDQNWLMLSNTSGSNNGEFTLTAQSNSNSGTRTAKIEISGQGISPQVINIIQDAGSPLLAVSTKQLTISEPSNAVTFTILSNTNWVVQSSQDWLTVDIEEGSGNETITLTAEPNPEKVIRSTSVIVSGTNIQPEVISVTQDGTSDFEEKVENIVTIYPNPVKDIIKVVKLDRNSVIFIYDLNKRLILSKIAQSPSDKIDVSSLTNGVYIIQINSDIKTRISKFIKQ